MFPIGTSDLISLDELAVLPKGGGFSAARSISERGRITLRNLARACERRRVRVSSHGCSTRRITGEKRETRASREFHLRRCDILGANYSVWNHLQFRFGWQFISIIESLVEKERKDLAIVYSDFVSTDVSNVEREQRSIISF